MESTTTTTTQQTAEFNDANTSHSIGEEQHSKKASFMEIMKQFSKECFAGSIAGSSGLIVGHPLDTIRVRAQTSTSSRGAMYLFREALAKEGARSLFKGLLSPLIGESINNCILFGVYNGLLPFLFRKVIGTQTVQEENEMRRNSIPLQFVSGSLAGACIAFVVCPTELIKIRLQTSTDPIKTRATDGVAGRRGFLDCAKYIWQNEGGLRGIYHGLSATMMRELTFNGIYFATYEQGKTRLSKYFAEHQLGEQASEKEVNALTEELRSNWKVVMSSGGMAGLAAWAFTYQTDVIKSVVQARSPVHARNGAYNIKIADVFAECKQSKSLFKGIAPTLVRAVPVNATTFMVYELVSGFLNRE